ncbi:unnamed protein product [Rhizoctonia solani]|uniref:Uncharacterized protein n=1 Tax=Rhizoctonia solani TaxID=456999 RepID=A0A8H2X8Y7_9AGAM|nr:unnamed protein product [Rhizoctonia solani]
MDYPPEDDDPVIWQCSQAAELKRIFADEPVPSAPPPSVPTPRPDTRRGSTSGPHGVKRKRRQDQDTPATTSAETLGLIQQLSRTLGGRRSSNSNPARRNTRIASAGNITFGMPPPKPKPTSSDEASASDGASFNRSRSSTTSPLVIGKPILESSSDSYSTPMPCTPPNRILAGPRPATEPTIPVSALLNYDRAESPELPPPAPAKPIISIRTDPDTINSSALSTRLNTAESATSTTRSDSFISVTTPTSPMMPLATLPPRPETPETPILDLTEISPTPSPEPKTVYNAPSKPKPPPVEAPESEAPTEAPRPVPSVIRATTDPTPPKRSSVRALQHTRSEPSQSFKPPTQTSFKPPTQQAFRPPTQCVPKLPSVMRSTQQQQNPRTFSSSQTRLGLGAMGKGYSGVNKPFKVPNKGKATVPLTVVPLPKRDGGGAARPSSPSRKKENIDAGRGKRGNSPTPGGRPSNRPTSVSSSRTTSGSSSRTSGSLIRTASSRAITGKYTQPRGASGSKRESGSDDTYIGSDESFDTDLVDADMAVWDSWND